MTHPQIFLFSGQNHFALLEEKRRWKQNFAEKHGEENLMVMDSKNLVMRELLDEISIAPFISGNRLVIVEGIIKCSKDEAKKLSEQIHSQTILLFVVQIDPSKKYKFPASMKEIDKIAEHKQFPILTRSRLMQWIDDELRKEGGTITPEARELLLEISGEDQGMLLQEIKKICLYANGDTINKSHVLDLAVTAGEYEVWRLMDLLGEGKVEEGIKYVESLIRRSDNVYGLWTSLMWTVSQLVLIWSVVQNGTTHPAAVCRDAGVPFPTARALIPCARKLKKESLTRIVSLVADMDKDLKTGVLRASVESPEELKAVIDRCLMEFAG
ncbi:DNA polymerase III subunit delta [Patescibacteria group bacterium]|nr:DNA polymerase III subunit delta [Patescibacteria group bacterium]MBU1123612.1 DNA polymerase III subunit delta [Patescibacteria group bacterium]MBU1911899.1 DNA polymerase III subunit delta [Patescibacteria group bacterium]